MAEQKGCRIIRDPDPGNQYGGVLPQFSKSFLLDLQSRVIDRSINDRLTTGQSAWQIRPAPNFGILTDRSIQ